MKVSSDQLWEKKLMLIDQGEGGFWMPVARQSCKYWCHG